MIQIDMEMPESCLKCEMSALCKVRQKEYVKHIMDKTMDEYYDAIEQGRLPNCPLIELPPHGRLIDIDALREEAEKLSREDNDYYLFEEHLLMALEKAPTILESNRRAK